MSTKQKIAQLEEIHQAAIRENKHYREKWETERRIVFLALDAAGRLTENICWSVQDEQNR